MIAKGVEESGAGELVPACPAGGAAPRFVFPRMLADRVKLGAGLTVAEYVNVYATSRQLGEETVRQYRIAVGRFEEWAGAGVRLDELSEMMLSAWLRHLEQRNAPSTVRSKRNQLLAVWRAAASEYLCDPPTRMVRAARVPWVPRECFTVDEVRDLLREASWLPRRHPCGLRRSDFWTLAIRIAWDTGLRWGDQFRLQADEVRGGMAVVKQAKTGAPVTIRLHPSTLRELETSLAIAPRELVTPWVASKVTFAAQFRRIVEKAGVSAGTWKWLRRGSGTSVEAQAPGRGMAARHLGHAPGSKVTELNYIAPKVVAAAVPAVMPEEL